MYQIVTIQKKSYCVFCFLLQIQYYSIVLWRKQIWILKQKSYTKKEKKKVSVFLRATLLYFPPVFILRSFVNLKGLGETFLTSCCSMVSFFYYLFKVPYYLQSFCANKRKFIVIRIRFIFLVHWWVCGDLDDYFEYLLSFLDSSLI